MNRLNPLDLPDFRCHKIVKAAKIARVERQEDEGAHLVLDDDSYLQVDAAYVAKHHPKGGGYYVLNDDGSDGYSPSQPAHDYSHLGELDPTSTDAMHWAEQFCKTIHEKKLPVEPSLVVSWFANFWAAVHDPMANRIENVRHQREIQSAHGNWNYSPYMHGMFNGLECALAALENREPQFREAPEQWLQDVKDDSVKVEDAAGTPAADQPQDAPAETQEAGNAGS
jgi:hypothetical protein